MEAMPSLAFGSESRVARMGSLVLTAANRTRPAASLTCANAPFGTVRSGRLASLTSSFVNFVPSAISRAATSTSFCGSVRGATAVA